jgi:hypothetical protein
MSVAILIPLGFCVALPIGINEAKAVYWGIQYSQMRHPPGTERIWLRQGIEKISNGDNCDFTLIEARSYARGSESSIRAFYAGQANPIDQSLSSLRPQFLERPPARPGIGLYEAFYAELARLHAGPYYLLEAWAVVESAPPLIDWRCP